MLGAEGGALKEEPRGAGSGLRREKPWREALGVLLVVVARCVGGWRRL